MGVGAAGIASGSAAGPASDAILKLFEPSNGTKALPHWVIIRVQPSSVQFFASNRHGVRGHHPVALFTPGSFGAALSRNIADLDLTLFPKKGDSISLKGMGAVSRVSDEGGSGNRCAVQALELRTSEAGHEGLR